MQERDKIDFAFLMEILILDDSIVDETESQYVLDHAFHVLRNLGLLNEKLVANLPPLLESLTEPQREGMVRSWSDIEKKLEAKKIDTAGQQVFNLHGAQK